MVQWPCTLMPSRLPSEDFSLVTVPSDSSPCVSSTRAFAVDAAADCFSPGFWETAFCCKPALSLVVWFCAANAPCAKTSAYANSILPATPSHFFHSIFFMVCSFSFGLVPETLLPRAHSAAIRPLFLLALAQIGPISCISSVSPPLAKRPQRNYPLPYES